MIGEQYMKNTKNKRKVIIGVAIGFLLLAAIIFFIITKRSNKSDVVSDAHTQEQLEVERSAFEITAEQRVLASQNKEHLRPLDAGRGNPNWINTQARYAFSRFMEFALQECERTFSEGTMAGQAKAEGITERFYQAMDPKDETDRFLIDAIAYCNEKLAIDKEALLKEGRQDLIGFDKTKCLIPPRKIGANETRKNTKNSNNSKNIKNTKNSKNTRRKK